MAEASVVAGASAEAALEEASEAALEEEAVPLGVGKLLLAHKDRYRYPLEIELIAQLIF